MLAPDLVIQSDDSHGFKIAVTLASPNDTENIPSTAQLTFGGYHFALCSENAANWYPLPETNSPRLDLKHSCCVLKIAKIAHVENDPHRDHLPKSFTLRNLCCAADIDFVVDGPEEDSAETTARTEAQVPRESARGKFTVRESASPEPIEEDNDNPPKRFWFRCPSTKLAYDYVLRDLHASLPVLKKIVDQAKLDNDEVVRNSRQKSV